MRKYSLQFLATFYLCSASLFSFGQMPSTDIWLFQVNNGKISGEPVKVTDRANYDNQPQFGGDILYYTTFDIDQTEVWAFNTKTGETYHITDTPESEYSPTPTPDGNHVSVIMVEKDSTQRLWKYHLVDRKRDVILMDLAPVGYHVWYGNYDLGLFVLGETNDLYIANSFNGQTEKVLEDIGRSLNPVPGEFRQFSFVKNQDEDKRTIMATDGTTHVELVDLPAGTQDFSWLNDSTVVTGVGPKLLSADLNSKQWQEWADLTNHSVNNITRIALNREKTLMAIVVSKQ